MGGPVQRILLDAERSGYPRECRMTALLLVGRSLGPDLRSNIGARLPAGFLCGVPGRHAGELAFRRFALTYTLGLRRSSGSSMLGVVRPVEPPEHCTSLRWFTVDGSTAAGERAVSSLVLSITP